MATGTWIYEKGTTSGGGGSVVIPPDAPPVVIGATNVREVYGGLFEVTVDWTAGAGATTVGVAIFLEDPDISTLAHAPMDGTIPLDGTSGLSGKWSPVRVGDDFESPALIEIKGQPKARDIRIYLQAYGSVKTATLIRANKPGATPSVVVTIPAALGEYVSGTEYAWLVTHANVIVVEEFENAAEPQYHLEFSYLAPDLPWNGVPPEPPQHPPGTPLPPGIRPFGGVMTLYEYDDGTQKEALFLDRDKPQDWHSGPYAAGNGGHFKVWFCSRDVDGRRNSPKKGVTPVADVTIVYPPAGKPLAPYITGFTLTNPRIEEQPDNTQVAMADLTWVPPASNRFVRAEFWRTGITPPRQFPSAGALITKQTLHVVDWPKVAEAWTIVAISVDDQGKQSDDPANPSVNAPRVTWNIGPPALGGSGIENTTLIGITGVTITTEQQLGNDGVVMMRHLITGWTNPSDNSYGGASIARVFAGDTAAPIYWDAAKSATSLTTDWEPAPTARTWFFYFVSRDARGKRNTLVPGTTPRVSHTYTPIANAIVPSRLPAGWWNPDEFQWPSYPAGTFQALSFVAKKIFVGSILRVGGGPTSADGMFNGLENGQVAVYNASNVMRAWMGQHDTTSPDQPTTAHTVFGGWFAELYVGGDSPVNAPLYATQAGMVIVGGFDTGSGRYPYISIQDNTRVEMGRIGARIGYDQVGVLNTIQGAWFRELAYGGTNFTDWRMLARMDATVPGPSGGASVQMRNINKFFIDYMANYPTAGNPTNAAMHLEFGYDAFVSDAVGNTNYYKFPGMTLYRTNAPNHGIALINRGIVIKGPTGLKLAALVSYNGDPLGADTATVFWGDLTMVNPVSGQIAVELASGNATNGGSSFVLRNTSNTVIFSADDTGCVIKGPLSGLSSLSLTSITVTGTTNLGTVTCSGTLTTGTNAITCYGLNASAQPISGSTIICTQVNAGSGAINCGSVNAGSGQVSCGTLSVTTFNPSSISTNFLNIVGSSSDGLKINGAVRVKQDGVWIGSVVCQDHVFGYDFGITGVAVGWPQTQSSGTVPPGGYGPGAAQLTTYTFATGDGRTVYVCGGIIVNVK